MFNLFKRKRNFDARAPATFAEAVSQMLLLQQVGAGTTPIEDDKGNINRQALGYIFGFVQAGIAQLGGDPLDAFVGGPIMLEVLKHLYPGCERRYLDFIMQRLETDKTMNDGAKYGGQQYLDYVARAHPTGGGAMGLARSLLGIPASAYFEDRKKYFRDGV